MPACPKCGTSNDPAAFYCTKCGASFRGDAPGSVRQPASLISHWYTLIEGLQTSALEFYKSVEDALRRRDVPDCESARVDWREGGMLSAKREYLRISRGRLAFDVCAAPFGRGYFFSWWLSETVTPHAFALGLLMFGAAIIFLAFCMWMMGKILGLFIGLLLGLFLLWMMAEGIRSTGAIVLEDAIMATPLLGWLYRRLFKPETYYRIDTMLMFQESVRQAVLETIDGLTSQQGLRSLSEQERQPRLKNLPLR